MRPFLVPLAALAALSLAPGLFAEDPPAPPAAPAAEPAAAPAFSVKDLDGKERTLAEFKDKWIVLEWTNLTCPFVKKHYAPSNMQGLQETYTKKGVVWLTVCSSGPGKPGNMSPEDWKKAVEKEKCHATAVLLDVDGKMGKAYGAKTTPDIRIVDPKGRLAYEGAIDDAPAKDADVTKARNYVREVLDAALAGKPVPVARTKSYG
jgi:hypothetical protein